MRDAGESARMGVLDGLPPADVADLLGTTRAFDLAPGETLFSQGEDADSMAILERGRVQVRVALAGQGTHVVRECGPGDVLGEVALLDGGRRSATLTAVEHTVGRLLTRDAVAFLRASRRPSYLTLLLRLAVLEAHRLRTLREQARADDVALATGLQPGGEPVQRSAASTLDPALLAHLPFFARFPRGAIHDLLAGLDRVDVPRTATLILPDDPVDRCFVVVRGAVQIARPVGGRWVRLQLVGPGQAIEPGAFLEQGPSQVIAFARERSTVVELSRTRFDALVAATDPLAFAVLDALVVDEVASLRSELMRTARLHSFARLIQSSEIAPGTTSRTGA